MENIVFIDGSNLDLDVFKKVIYKGYKVKLKESAKEKVLKSRAVVDGIVEREEVVYGITTGFGEFSNVRISKKDTKQLQKNLIISHAIGTGDIFPANIARGVMLLRANALAKGYSGIRLSTLQHLIDILNSDVSPVIPEQGSVGSSGDLAPLAHMVLTMIGVGDSYYKLNRMPADQALEKAGLKPVELDAKEGLALINGTQVMSSVGMDTLLKTEYILKTADIVGTLSLDSLLGTDKAFKKKLHELRPHRGQIESARNIYNLLKGSGLRESHTACSKVQDAYSLRCMPVVHGASRNAFYHIKDVLLTEVNSVTDNPVIFQDEVISGGNFHGQPVALVMDYLGIALSEIGNISERRTERLVNPALSNGLPGFLVEKGGLNSGFMIAQYTQASLVSENKVLAHPASVDSIPTSANKEDHVSMGTIGARKASKILEHTAGVLAVELIAACQACQLRKLKTSEPLQKLIEEVRKDIPFLEKDTFLYNEFQNIKKKILEGVYVNLIKEFVDLV